MPRNLNLKERHGVVQSLWTAVNEGGGWLQDIPRLVRTVIDTRAWEEREVDGRIIAHKRFVDFITADPRAGCGWPPAKVEALIKDDPVTLAMWREAVTNPEGRPHETNNNIISNSARALQGTSKAYTLDRLKREAPALFQAVCAGDLSANKAAIEAGFRKKPTPFEQVQKLIPKLTAAERRKLKELLS